MIALAVMGLFRGFSGSLAFVAATAAAVVAGFAGWPLSERWLTAAWARGAATLVAVLLVFGFVRLVIKKTVNRLLSQPSDAIFGMLVGLALGVLLLAVWAYSGFFVEYSSIASRAAEFAGAGGGGAPPPDGETP